MTAFDRILDALTAHDARPSRRGAVATARCPAHEDRSPSLSLRAIEGQALVHCHAGCATDDVLAAVGLSLRDLYDEPSGARYDYLDRAGGTVLRSVHRTPDKRFRQSGQTRGTGTLYRLPQVLAAAAAGQTVYVVEGEKDVHALEAVGAVATCAPMGAGKWPKVDPTPLRGAHVVVIPDQDDPGRRHAADVVASLEEVAEVTVAAPKVGKDAADHIAAGYGVDELVPVVLDVQLEAQLEAQAGFARDVAAEAYRLRVRDTAREQHAATRAAAAAVPFDAGLLADILARPPEPPHRVDGLIPTDAATLVVAQRKTGKTTLLLNLARALVLGGEFLGRFPVRPVAGRVGFLNFEVSAAAFARWAHEAGVPPERLYVVNLRGRRNPFGVAEDLERLALSLREHDVESLIVDPFGRAYSGASQNDPGEVGAWLAELDRFARASAGVRDLVLAAHAGWDGERTRGSSALEDWADSIVTLVRDRDDDQARFLRAEGRDVLVEEDQLLFDQNTRSLRLAGAGSRKTASRSRRVEQLIPTVVELVLASPGLTGYGITKALTDAGHAFTKGDEGKAASLAVDRGLLDCEAGPRGSRRYFDRSNAQPPRTSPHFPGGKVDDLPDLPSIDGEVVPGRSGGSTSPDFYDLFSQKADRCSHGYTPEQMTFHPEPKCTQADARRTA